MRTVPGRLRMMATTIATAAIERRAGRFSQCGTDNSQLTAIQTDVPSSAALLARSTM